MAIGQSPNPTVQRSTPQLVTNRGKITVDPKGQTSMARVFAGGDVVRGGSTVILAMRDGRAAAAAIHEALKDHQSATCSRQVAADYEPGLSPASADAGLKPGATSARAENRILAKRLITPEIAWFEVQATGIARHWQAGQFVILRPRADSERIPLTLVDGDPEKGTITLVVQGMGKTSRVMVGLECGEVLSDLLGPLGQAASDRKCRARCLHRRRRGRGGITARGASIPQGRESRYRLVRSALRRRRSFWTRNSARRRMKSYGPPTTARRECTARWWT